MSKIASFAAGFAAEFAWLDTNARKGNTFAESLLQNVSRWGGLTERQLEAVRRNINNPPQTRTGETMGTEALFDSFEKATRNGLKRPRLHFGSYAVSKAPETGNNPGALYVKRDDGTYLGKIFKGAFFGSRDCTPEVSGELRSLISDPAAAVKAYGLRTGNCAICNRELTDPESVERGIGPICAGRFGWA